MVSEKIRGQVQEHNCIVLLHLTPDFL